MLPPPRVRSGHPRAHDEGATVMALGEIVPTWVMSIERAMARGDRLVVSHEVQLRVVLRSDGFVGVMLDRAARLIGEVTRELREQVVWARRVFFVHRHEAHEEEVLRIAHRIGAVQLHLIGLLIAGMSVETWQRQIAEGVGPEEVREKACVGLGVVPLAIEVESWMDPLFDGVRLPEVEA